MIESTNLLDPSAIVTGKYMWNGNEYTNASYNYTGFIPVEEGKTYSFQLETSSIPRKNISMRFICTYDSDKVYKTSVENTSADNGFTIPSGISYIIVSSEAANFGMKAAIVEGTAIIPYEEYFPTTTEYSVKAVLYNEE